MNEYIKQSKKDVTKQIVDYWKNKLEFLDNKWFLNNEGKTKKGIGWMEKISFQKEIEKLHEDVVKEIEKSIQLSSALIYEQSSIVIVKDQELKEVYGCIKILDEVLQNKYQKELIEIFERIPKKREEIYLLIKPIIFALNPIINLPVADLYRVVAQTSFISALNPIINCPAGDLYRDVVVQTSLNYIKSIESCISTIFGITVRPINLSLETLIKFYNSVLEKQISYEQESPDQQQNKAKMIKEQLEKLNTIQASLKEILL